MTAPELLIRPVCVTPPCITANSRPSHVSVTLAVSLVDSRYPGLPFVMATSRGHEDFDLFRPWLLSAFQESGEQALPRQVPTCVHSSSEEVLVTFRDLEFTAAVPGIITLALCPAAPEHSGQTATVEAIPLMVSPNAGGNAEAVAMFDCMKQLVQEQEHTQQQHHDPPYQQQHLQDSQLTEHSCAAAGSCFMSAAPTTQSLAGMDAPDALSFNMPCTQQQAAAATAAACMPGACCAHCNFGKPEAAAEQALLRSTWQQHFLPLLLDMHAALTCAPNPIPRKHDNAATASENLGAAAAHEDSSTCSFAAAARVPNALEGWAKQSTSDALHSFGAASAAAASCEIPATAVAAGGQPAAPAILLQLVGCAPPPVDVAGKILIGVGEFLALHNCWCTVSFLLAEAFKNGLLATTGVLAAQQLQRLHDLQRVHAPVCHAALTAAALMSSLANGAAAADEEEAAEVAAAPIAEVAYHSTAGSVTAHSSSVRTNRSAAAASTSADSTAPCAASVSDSAASWAASACSDSPAPFASHVAGAHTTVLAVLLLLLMPAAAVLLAEATGPGGISMQGAGVPVASQPLCGSGRVVAGVLPSGLASAAPALQLWLYSAVLSVVLLVLVVVSCSRDVLLKQSVKCMQQQAVAAGASSQVVCGLRQAA